LTLLLVVVVAEATECFFEFILLLPWLTLD